MGSHCAVNCLRGLPAVRECSSAVVRGMGVSGVLLSAQSPPSVPFLRMETRARWQIPNELREEMHPNVRDAAVEMWRSQRPNARLRSISATYNCIGMVVAFRRSWVDPGDLLRILKEDGYRKLGRSEEARLGDVVVYRDAQGSVSHAGIIIGFNLYDSDNPKDARIVLSKWGRDGEYEHDETDVPVQLGSPSEYWSHRVGV